MANACPYCACASEAGAATHALLALLAEDDLDAALEHGLLGAPACPDCTPGCNARLAAAAQARRDALAARARYRARAARLDRRKAEREAARAVTPAPADAGPVRTPALPPAAADVLARALARAAERRQR